PRQSKPAPAPRTPQESSLMKPKKTKNPIALLAGWLALALAPTHAAENASGASLPPPPDPSREDPITLSIFQVTGEKDEGYRSTQTVSGSRTLKDLRDTPNSISVLNREFLDDLIATQLS